MSDISMTIKQINECIVCYHEEEKMNTWSKRTMCIYTARFKKVVESFEKCPIDDNFKVSLNSKDILIRHTKKKFVANTATSYITAIKNVFAAINYGITKMHIQDVNPVLLNTVNKISSSGDFDTATLQESVTEPEPEQVSAPVIIQEDMNVSLDTLYVSLDTMNTSIELNVVEEPKKMTTRKFDSYINFDEEDDYLFIEPEHKNYKTKVNPKSEFGSVCALIMIMIILHENHVF